MNNKGNMKMVGTLIVAFIAIVTALAMFNGGITSNVAATTNTDSITNQTLTAPAVNGTINLQGRATEGTVIIVNGSNSDVASGFTVLNDQIDSSTGELTAQLRTDDGGSDTAGNTINVTYTFQPDGYITTSGGRSLATLINIFAALAIAIFTLAIIFRSQIMDLFR